MRGEGTEGPLDPVGRDQADRVAGAHAKPLGEGARPAERDAGRLGVGRAEGHERAVGVLGGGDAGGWRPRSSGRMPITCAPVLLPLAVAMAWPLDHRDGGGHVGQRQEAVG